MLVAYVSLHCLIFLQLTRPGLDVMMTLISDDDSDVSLVSEMVS